jgi:hypothetical protein
VYTEFQIDIVSVNEAKRPSDDLEIEEYSLFRCDTDLVVYVSNRINAEISDVRTYSSNDLSLLQIELRGLRFYFAYCRDGSSKKGISSLLNRIKSQNHPKSIVLGDLNARMINCSPKNQAGTYLEYFLQENIDSFSIMNDSSIPSFQRNNYASLLDYCIVSSNAINLVSECLTSSLLKSDHKAIILSLGTEAGEMSTCDYKRAFPIRALNIRLMNERKAEKLSAAIDSELLSTNPQLINDPHIAWSKFTTNIKSAILSTFRRKSTRRKQHVSEEVMNLIKKRAKCKNEVDCAKLTKLIRPKIAKEKYAAFQRFIDDISSDESSYSVWKNGNVLMVQMYRLYLPQELQKNVILFALTSSRILNRTSHLTDPLAKNSSKLALIRSMRIWTNRGTTLSQFLKLVKQ